MSFFEKIKKDRQDSIEEWKTLSVGTKIFRITLAIFILVAFVTYQIYKSGPSVVQSEKPSEKPPAVTPASLGLVSGVEYKYYSDGSCKPDLSSVCLDRDTYIAICSLKPKMGNKAMPSRFLDPDFATLSEAGYEGEIYSINPESDRPCIAKLVASGMLNGTSRRVSIETQPMVFVVNSKGDLLVTYTHYLHPSY